MALRIDTDMISVVKRKSEAFFRDKTLTERGKEKAIALALERIYDQGPVDKALVNWMENTDRRRVDMSNMRLNGHVFRKPAWWRRLWWTLTTVGGLSYQKKVNQWIVDNPRIVIRKPI
jgi:hypothetical protein